MNLLNYIILPKETSATELKHVARINKIALFVCYLHVPVFVIVAHLCGTGVIDALVYSALILAGPTVASFAIKDPRTLSLVFGFTSMCLGALLVHLGQSSVQIEMHFHFFVFLALLAAYGNPLTVVVAAVTVAVHHLIFFLFLPTSVFNYDAAIWVVGIHAAFVVLESIASCFIARSFYDNVIGLEKIVNKRTAELDKRNLEMQLILDNASQGFLTITGDGAIEKERSAVIKTWFGTEDKNSKIWDFIGKTDDHAGDFLRIGFDAIADDFMPLEITLDQLPKRIKVNKETTIGCEYNPVTNEDGSKKFLLVATDITAALQREAYEKEQSEIVEVFEKMTKDRSGFMEFVEEANQLVDFTTNRNNQDNAVEIKRALHTLKGIAGVFAITSIFDLCHEIETHIEEEGAFSNTDRKILYDMWAEKNKNYKRLLGDGKKTLDIAEDDLATLIDLLHSGSKPKEAINLVKSWRFEPTEKRLNRIAEQAKAIADRLRKGNLHIDLDHQQLRLSQAAWANFWSAFIHVVRNAVDHGLEEPTEGVKKQNNLALRTVTTDKELIIEIEDNGRGIDWAKLKAKAVTLGLPHSTNEELIDIIFTDGVSTKSEATSYSGRGVGMGAAKSACENLGGKVKVHSEPGKGTRVSFSFPIAAMEYEVTNLSKAA